MHNHARRVLDRLLGYQISPILWQKVRKGLSAGRVQSVAMKIICDKEKEIEEFIPQEYWSIEILSKNENKEEITLKFYGNEEGKIELNNEDEVDKILENINSKEAVVKDLESKLRKRKLLVLLLLVCCNRKPIIN